jgi:Flp pilus assembly protein TadB
VTATLLGGLVGLGALALVALQRARPRLTIGAQLTAVLVLGAVVGLVLAPLVAVVSALAALGTVLADRSRKQRRAEVAAQRAWPTVLEELTTRLVGFGDPLPQALFAAAWPLPPELRHALARAERLWQVSGDLPSAIDAVLDMIGPASRETLVTLARLAHLPSAEAAEVVAALAGRHREEAALAIDLHARLAGARLARSFVVGVPALLLAVGVVIGGGPAPYLSRLGATTLTIAVLIIAACWAWADHYLEKLLAAPRPSRFLTHLVRRLAREEHP